jgi:hypothetical protein
MTSAKVAARPTRSGVLSGIDAGHRDPPDDDARSSDEGDAKRDVLSRMGGPSALGKGFADYASSKFNLSQLGAISASAQEYGEGGFTLIKGPPGKTFIRDVSIDPLWGGELPTLVRLTVFLSVVKCDRSCSW